MTSPLEGAPPARPPLARGHIVDIALELIAEIGVERLSMRLLSERLGVSLGATYRHVANRDELLDLCARRIFESARRPRTERMDPLAWVREQVLALYDAMQARPGMAAHVATRSDLTPPGMIRHVHDALLAAGFGEREAAEARLVLAIYTSGALLMDAQTVLAFSGVDDPRAVIASGLDYILQSDRRRPSAEPA